MCQDCWGDNSHLYWRGQSLKYHGDASLQRHARGGPLGQTIEILNAQDENGTARPTIQEEPGGPEESKQSPAQQDNWISVLTKG